MADYIKNGKPANAEYKDTKSILEKIADRYIKANPECDFCMRPWIDSGFLQSADGLFDIDMNEKYPDSVIGSYCYVMTFIVSEEDMTVTVAADIMCGAEIWVNGELIAKTTVDDEAEHKKKNLPIKVFKGKNPVFIKLKKTALGFGVRFGEACIAWKPIYMHMPFCEYDGYIGFAYSQIFGEDIYKNVSDFPDVNGNMPQGFVKPALCDKYAFDKNGYVYSCTYFETEKDAEIEFVYDFGENSEVYSDGIKIFSASGKGRARVFLTSGRHYLAVETMHSCEDPFSYELTAAENGKILKPKAPHGILSETPWLTMGVLKEQAPEITKSFIGGVVLDGYGGSEFWRAGISRHYFRKLRKYDIFGKWTYPIGVVLYGLTNTAECLDKKEISDYVSAHLLTITENQPWADLDMKRYGVPSINRPSSCLGMLDYCGSCGNAMLAARGISRNKESYDAMAARIAHYMEYDQERLENGMFYRNRKDSVIDCMTVWADDLYMSIPFLCRYYLFTGEERYLQDAVRQILCYKELLYMENRHLMSHVFNLNHKKRTEVPWGRANGWTLFALTELLGVLPENHDKYAEIMRFYLDFCEGIASRQDENGMWHQVIDEPDSYEEASCTAMFVYAFAKGVLSGRLDKKYAKFAKKGWHALTSYAVDTDGNVYGVCCGSAYSFRSDYYKNELPWLINDTHGTGIVLLAGVEIVKLEKEF